jgi:hypothetical protein
MTADDRMSRRVPLFWQGLAPPLPTTTPARQPASAAVGTAAAAASAASSSTHVLSGAVVGDASSGDVALRKQLTEQQIKLDAMAASLEAEREAHAQRVQRLNVSLIAC